MSARTRLKCSLFVASIIAVLVASTAGADEAGKKIFRAGAAAVGITPTNFPVIVSGYFNERKADRAHDRLMSRSLVLDDGTTRLAIVVVDSLMIKRDLLDLVKQTAEQETGIRADRILISATHTHSAPSVMGALGSGADPEYLQFLPGQIVKSIVLAAKNLTAARIGWTVVQDHEHNHCRRWIFRPNRIATDPFGRRNVRAHMHPGHQSANHIGPSGPADPDLTLLSVQRADGRPLAVLGNYAMHYYGTPAVSADFCGRFGGKLASLIGAADTDPPFVGMMSQGTSGDSMWPDYTRPAGRRDLDAYTEAVARVAHQAYEKIEYRDWVSLSMAEAKLKLRRRVPDEKRLEWARQIVAELKDRQPRGMAEIYAREQIYLHEEPEVELKLQAIRIGELGITAIPNEVYGITGIKLKARSPLPTTFNIELANGAQGYIPPPEQHLLGGYTTWPARTAGLEVEAEPKIVSTLLDLLEKVSDKPRRKFVDPRGDYAEAVLASGPVAYWRLGELDGSRASDATGKHHGSYERGVVFFLPGPEGDGLSTTGRGNRGAHFAGGRVKASVNDLGDAYSVELWFWNGLPSDARAVTGYFFSRGADGAKEAPGDHLGIGGTHLPASTGRLMFFNGNKLREVLTGQTRIMLKTWNHVVLVRDGKRVTVYLNGNQQPDISGEAAIGYADGVKQLFIGGRNDNLFNFEGKLDEVAVYNRVLSPEEVAAHFQAAGYTAPKPPKPPKTSAAQPQPPPKSPAQSFAMLHVRDGFEVELVAAEPMVIDPVAVAWGANGKLWVVEMADYPSGIDGQGKAGGRIRYLQDTDDDGKYDKSTLFLDGVNFPNGILPWGKGVLVTAAPEIFYAEDTNGDGKADVRRSLYTGFLEGNQQLRVNGLRWGLDNWVYCAAGGHHSGYGSKNKIRSCRRGTVIPVGSRDFRIRPEQGLLDPLAGPSQFGRNRDDWGNWFGVQNSFPLWHYVLEDRYTRRNPHYPPPDPRQQLLLPSNPKVFPAKPPQKRFHSFGHSGHFTSACSAVIYRDELLFGRGEVQHSFTCEPVHNLVHHAVLTEEGVSFTARRAAEEQNSEFFASEDRWCRPVMVRTGPDGALWVVDMYRYMIEHPQWLPQKGKDELRPFYRSGDDRGRIYRVYRAGKRPRRIPRLDTMSTQQLVAALESPSGWQRDTAQRLLVRQRDMQAVAPLAKMAVSSKFPLARLHALCTLDGLDALDAEMIQRALADAHPAVRRHAVRFAESRAAGSPQLITSALRLIDDRSPKVRLQLACTLGQWEDPRTGAALAQLALSQPDDHYTRAAVMSSVNKTNIAETLATVLAACRDGRQPGELVGQLLSLSVALGQDEATAEAVAQVSTPRQGKFAAWQLTAVADLLDALDRRHQSIGSLIDKDGRVEKLLAAARTIVADVEADEKLRRAAVPLLARQPDRRAADILALSELLVPQTLASIQEAVVSHLGRQQGRRIAEMLLAGWRSHGPALRAQILSVLASRKDWVNALLDSIEGGKVLSAEIDAATRQRLASHKDADLRRRLEKLLALASTTDRQEVLSKFQFAAKLKGNRTRGEAMFKNKCATCHKQGDTGYEVGPNLNSLTDRSPEALLESILDPSRVVVSKYVNYIAITDDGRSHSGVLISETGSSITLIGPDGKREVILRNALEELQSTGKSLMPDGLEKDVTAQDLADLIAFIAPANGRTAAVSR